MATTVHAHPSVHAFVTQDVPPSPTLTNPDMILPWQAHGTDPTHLSTSPTYHPERTPPRHSHDSDNFSASPREEIGIAKAVVMPCRIKPPSLRTISHTYQTYDVGGPLSDIGEESSTPRSRKTARTRSQSPPLSESPTRSSVPIAKYNNRYSIASSTGSDIGDWENFDSTQMMNERLAADVANAQDDLPDLDGLESKRNSIVPSAEDEVTTLNRKAERILASAKKRLTHMEDNLSKARNSILISPKSSPIVGDVHQPVGGLYRSISQGGDRRLGQGYMRKSKPLYPVIRTVQNGHIRGVSETSMSPDSTFSPSPQTRSASALDYRRRPESLLPDYSPVGISNGHSPGSSRSYNSPLRILEEEDGSPSTTRTSPQTPAPRGLGITTSSPREDLAKIYTLSSPTGQVKSSSQSSIQSTRELRNQMSDLKIRIADLKHKAQADSLRRQSLQHSRTPSPFTQAPEKWYAAAPEYREAGTPINTNAGLGWSPSQRSAPFGTPRSPKSPKNSAFGDGDGPTPITVRTDINTQSLHQKNTPLSLPTVADDGIPFMLRSQYEDAPEQFEYDPEDQVATSEEEQIYLNEALEESLQDSEPEIPIILDEDFAGDDGAERHEDRADAFDYENMFLHSALGNYSQNGMRGRIDSESGSSVETRRAAQRTPGVDDDEDELEDRGDERQSGAQSQDESSGDSAVEEEEAEGAPTPKALSPPVAPWMKAARSNSMDSVNTTATFETATEGFDGSEEEDEDGIPQEILNWGTTAQKRLLSSPKRQVWPTPALESSTSNGRNTEQEINSESPEVVGSSPTLPHFQSARPMIREPLQRAQAPSPMEPAPPAQAPHPANTEILMASLITLADPTFQMPSAGNVFADVDKELVIRLLRGVGAVVGGILKSGDGYERKDGRRKLDGARRVLDGEIFEAESI